ncbi:MATE efflux family protein 3, chloroplastic [Hordeum vulgare]|nr:MATE efflux family protein 3, chloroplastic [Hordeum vulgare]
MVTGCTRSDRAEVPIRVRTRRAMVVLGEKVDGFANVFREQSLLVDVKPPFCESSIDSATGRDGNNNIYPIAFGVVDKEDGDSWTWFRTELRCCIGSGSKFGTYTIISDRQKSAGLRAAELKKLVDKASYSFTKHGHELGMTLLKAECEGAWKWLEKIPKETWCSSKSISINSFTSSSKSTSINSFNNSSKSISKGIKNGIQCT